MGFWSNTNWLLILSLILGSAALAILGDILGFKYGKQRISLFGLRPKHTSRLITALTGGVITVLVLAVLTVLSQDVRTALFSMKYVQQQLYDLQVRLAESQAIADQARSELAAQQGSLELARLDLETLRNDRLLLEQEREELDAELRAMREEADQLKGALRTMKSEAIALSANVLLAQRAFPAGCSSEDAAAGLEALRREVRLSVLEHVSDQLLSRLRDLPIQFDPEEEAAVLAAVTGSEERRYVRALARENVAFGESIPVRLETGESLLIYSDGETIYRRAVNPQDPGFQAEEALHIFLRDLKRQAIHDGVLPDPATNNVGTLGGEDFFAAVEALHAIQDPVIINALAVGDIHTEGPVAIRLTFEE